MKLRAACGAGATVLENHSVKDQTRHYLSAAALRRHLSIATTVVVLIAAVAAVNALAAGKAVLKIESDPPGALVSVVHVSGGAGGDVRAVAGTTPLAKAFDFGKAGRLSFVLEKRGYAPATVEAGPATGAVTVTLSRVTTAGGAATGASTAAPPHTIALVGPEVRVTLRHFAHEEVSLEQGTRLAAALAAAIHVGAAGRAEVVTLAPAQGGAEDAAHKALWRDARTSMELLDPIRLAYLAEAPTLETRSGRDAARTLAAGAGADALLVITGRQTVETGGMKAGKVAMFAAGTAISYGGAYSAAMARGDSFFVYPIYLPAFAQGLLLQAALVRGADGEVLWVDRGVWPAVNPDDSAAVARVANELLAGLP